MSRRGNQEKKQYGLSGIGQVKVWKNNYGYSTTIGRKEEDGTYTNVYLNLYFPKDTKTEDLPKNGEDIIITDSFFFVVGREGNERLALYIRDWSF